MYHRSNAPLHDGSWVPVGSPSRGRIGPVRSQETLLMFSFLRRRFSKSAYTWKPALDLTDPRIAATLFTFGGA